MTKKQLDNLWELYREFCTAINAASVYAPDFLAWIERFKLEKEEQEVDEGRLIEIKKYGRI